jgi:hypothetical protein
MIRQPSALALAIDTELSTNVRGYQASEHRMAVLLARMDHDKLHQEFGYAKLTDYAAERLGLEPHQTRALLRIGKKLPDLPLLDRAMADGQLGWTKVRELAKVLTPQNESAWIELARAATSRLIERAVQACGKDGAPPSLMDLEDLPEQVVLTFRLSGRDAEMVRMGLQLLRASCGPGTELLEDGALLAMIVQRSIVDADPETAPTPDRHRFVVESRSDQDASHVVPAEACCDAEVVEMGAGPKRGHVSHTIPPARRRAVLHRDRFRCRVPGCTNRLWLDLHHVDPRENGGSNAESNLLTACCVHHRMIHEQYLEVYAENGGFRFVFPDGRQVGGRPVEERVSPRSMPRIRPPEPGPCAGAA